jgi:hypothetical protein
MHAVVLVITMDDGCMHPPSHDVDVSRDLCISWMHGTRSSVSTRAMQSICMYCSRCMLLPCTHMLSPRAGCTEYLVSQYLHLA